jgi:predicted Zn-dependent protease
MCWIQIRQRFCTARRICGYVVFFRGLIDTTECPEELATVFAHEIGHVEARDPTRIALRSAGSIDVLGLLFGRAQWRTGAVGGERIIKGDDTQDADLPPSAIATLFSRLALQSCEDAGIMEHLMSHPAFWGRIAAARAAEPEDAKFRPVLSESEYDAQRAICY